MRKEKDSILATSLWNAAEIKVNEFCRTSHFKLYVFLRRVSISNMPISSCDSNVHVSKEEIKEEKAVPSITVKHRFSVLKFIKKNEYKFMIQLKNETNFLYSCTVTICKK
jgi:hypothetical protein